MLGSKEEKEGQKKQAESQKHDGERTNGGGEKTTMGAAGKGDDGDGNGEDERNRRKKNPDSKVSISDEEGEEGEEDDEEDQAGKIMQLQSNPGSSREREKLPRQAKNLGQERGGARPKKLPLGRTQKILANSRKNTEEKKALVEKTRQAEKVKATQRMKLSGRETFENHWDHSTAFDAASITSSKVAEISSDAGSEVSSLGPIPPGFDENREYEKESVRSAGGAQIQRGDRQPQLSSLLQPIDEEILIQPPSPIVTDDVESSSTRYPKEAVEEVAVEGQGLKVKITIH